MALLYMLRVIFIIDGSGSIDTSSYDQILHQYYPLVKSKEYRIEAYQFSDRITSIESQQYGGTNTYIAFEKLAEIIETGKECMYLVVFVSDGQKNAGPDEDNLLSRFSGIDKEKQIYLVSVAIGKYSNKSFFDKIKKIIPHKEIPDIAYPLLAENSAQIITQFSLFNNIKNSVYINSGKYFFSKSGTLKKENNQLYQENTELKINNDYKEQEMEELMEKIKRVMKVAKDFIKKQEDDLKQYERNKNQNEQWKSELNLDL